MILSNFSAFVSCTLFLLRFDLVVAAHYKCLLCMYICEISVGQRAKVMCGVIEQNESEVAKQVFEI